MPIGYTYSHSYRHSYANGTPIRGGQLQPRGRGTWFELGQAATGIGTDVGHREQPGDPRHPTVRTVTHIGSGTRLAKISIPRCGSATWDHGTG